MTKLWLSRTVSGSVLYSSINKTVKSKISIYWDAFLIISRKWRETAMVQSLSNLQVHNEILPATARVTYNNQTRVPDLLWILRFNTRYIRASLVYRTIQKGHTYYSTSEHRDLIHITRPQVKSISLKNNIGWLASTLLSASQVS